VAARLDILGEKGILTLDLEGCIGQQSSPETEPGAGGAIDIERVGSDRAEPRCKGVRLAAGKYENTHDIIVSAL